MGQRRIAIVSLDGGRLKVVWMDERGGRLGVHVLRNFDAEVAVGPRLLEQLKDSLARDYSATGMDIQIQAESIQLYEILASNPHIRALLSPRVGPRFIHEEFKAWQSGTVDAQDELPRGRGAADNGITAEEGDSNE